MATYYVHQSIGNDSNAGTVITAPKETLTSAIAAATSDGDIIEIIDQGSYNEYGLEVEANDLTVHHTASNLGRPKIYTTVKGRWAFNANTNNKNGLTLKGLEMYYFTQDGVSSYGGLVDCRDGVTGITIEDCFAHQISFVNAGEFGGSSEATAANIKKSIIYIDERGSASSIITQNSGWLNIENCLITSSGGRSYRNQPIVNGQESPHVTASFSTFVHRGRQDEHGADHVILRDVAKVINCIVSGSMNAIRATDHSYNVVFAAGDGHSFVDAAGNTTSAGTGDQADTHPLFVDGDTVGVTTDIAENFKLLATSPARDAGISFGDLDTDLNGDSRVIGGCNYGIDIGAYEYQAGEQWSAYGTYDRLKIGSDLLINSVSNVLRHDHKFNDCVGNAKQAPFSLAAKGPINLRFKKTAYKAEKGKR